MGKMTEFGIFVSKNETVNNFFLNLIIILIKQANRLYNRLIKIIGRSIKLMCETNVPKSYYIISCVKIRS